MTRMFKICSFGSIFANGKAERGDALCLWYSSVVLEELSAMIRQSSRRHGERSIAWCAYSGSICVVEQDPVSLLCGISRFSGMPKMR